MGFPKYEKEDYGQTLGKWGVGPGCYLVLPVLGPSTVRDTLVLLLMCWEVTLGIMHQCMAIMSF